jgi:broad specificity phosphatase PhoE
MPAQTILVIRHAEKPAHAGAPFGVDEDGRPDVKSLAPRGWQRAGALAPFFAPSRGEPSDPLKRPKQLFAARADPDTDDDSKRPLQTLQPLAACLATAIDESCAKDELEPLIAKAKAADGPVLIAWEHKRIPRLAKLLLPNGEPVPDWPDERFDMVWIFHNVGDAWRLTQAPQLLLAGDSPQLFS